MGTLAVGGAFTAIILGLAAQQTIGNVAGGIVLQGTRPFRVGGSGSGSSAARSPDRSEGTVSSLGLFYTTLAQGADRLRVQQRRARHTRPARRARWDGRPDRRPAAPPGGRGRRPPPARSAVTGWMWVAVLWGAAGVGVVV